MCCKNLCQIFHVQVLQFLLHQIISFGLNGAINLNLWDKQCSYTKKYSLNFLGGRRKYKVGRHTGLNVSTLSRPPLAQFSRGGKYHFRSCGFTASYLFEMFFTTREKCCYMLIFANECAVLIESFEKRFEATPFCHILYRWSKLFSLFSL